MASLCHRLGCQGVTGGPARHRLEDVVAWNEVGHIWQSSITCVRNRS